MSEEEKLAENKEEVKPAEAKVETVKEEKKAPAEVNKEYKRTDYEYKSWSSGRAVLEGWERCPGYPDVIRRLKVAPPKPEEPAAETKPAEPVETSSSKGDKKGQCGCCR